MLPVVKSLSLAQLLWVESLSPAHLLRFFKVLSHARLLQVESLSPAHLLRFLKAPSPARLLWLRSLSLAHLPRNCGIYSRPRLMVEEILPWLIGWPMVWKQPISWTEVQQEAVLWLLAPS